MTCGRRLIVGFGFAALALLGGVATCAAAPDDVPKFGADMMAVMRMPMPASGGDRGLIGQRELDGINRHYQFGRDASPLLGAVPIFHRGSIVPPGKGTGVDANRSNPPRQPRYDFRYATGDNFYEDLCDNLKRGSFASLERPAILLDLSSRTDKIPCRHIPSDLAKFTEQLKAFPSVSEVHHWPVGRAGFVLFSNRLFPRRGESAGFGTEIDSKRLAALLSFVVTLDAGYQRSFPKDQIVRRAASEDCACVGPKTGWQEAIEAQRYECVTRTYEGEMCPGKLSKWSEERELRRTFRRDAFDSRYLTVNSLTKSNNRMAGNSDERYDSGNLVVSMWCQLDPLFPCTEIEVTAFTASIVDEPSDAAHRTRREFAEDFAQQLAEGLCPTCDRVITHGFKIKVRGVGKDQRSPFGEINREIKQFAAGPFGFLAIPIGLLRGGEVDISGLLPVDIKDDNKDPARLFKEARYSWVRPITLIASTLVGRDQRLFAYVRMVSTKSSAATSCQGADITCIATALVANGTGDIDWYASR